MVSPVSGWMREETPSAGHPRRAWHAKDRRPLRRLQGPGRSQPGLSLSGLKPPATVERGAHDPKSRTLRAHTRAPIQGYGCAHECFPFQAPTPGSPATLSRTSMMMRALRNSSVASFSPDPASAPYFASRFPPAGFDPHFFARRRSDPSRAAFRHEEGRELYSPSRR